jgi:membrane protein YqaA with SNARE-associated domain
MFKFHIHNVCQRVCVWLVALSRTKLIKETEPVGKSAGFSEYTQTKQLVIHVVGKSFYFMVINILFNSSDSLGLGASLVKIVPSSLIIKY